MKTSYSPTALFILLVVIIFGIETATMFALDYFLPEHASRWVHAILDSSTMTVIVSVFVWKLFVMPLKFAALSETAQATAVLNGAAEAVITLTEDNTIESCNPATERMFGYQPNELLSKNVKILMPQSHAGDDDDNIARYVRNGKKLVIGRPWEIQARRKDGTGFLIDISLTEFRLVGMRRFTCIIRDITERKRIERELAEAEAQFRALVEQSIAGIYIVQDGKLVYINPRFAQILGYGSTKELIGRDGTDVVAEKDRAMVRENQRQQIEGEMPSLGYTYTALRKDGSRVDVGVHDAPATHRGRPAIIGLVQDISEKKRAEEQISRYVKQLEKTLMGTVEVATTLSEMRDPYTAGHERRVAEIAVALGSELGFDQNRLEGLRVAGYLHDIGKITIPAEILSKPGKLSAIEFMLIQGHSQAGYDVLKNVEFPWPVAQIVLQHHERHDGSGYPNRLKGDAIVMEARILAVADTV